MKSIIKSNQISRLKFSTLTLSLVIIVNLMVLTAVIVPFRQGHHSSSDPNKSHDPLVDSHQARNCLLSHWLNDPTESGRQCLNNAYHNETVNLEVEFNSIIRCHLSLPHQYYRLPNNYFTFIPIRIIGSSSKKIISFSLYGSAKRYISNIVKVVRVYKRLLPDWTPRFWIGSDVPCLLINRLIYEGAEIIIVYQPIGREDRVKIPSYHGMFWRFFVADDVNVERYIIRDADSLPLQREVDAMNQWINESTMFHVMRDHPYHNIEILGGMWGGLVNTSVLNITRLYREALEVGGYHKLDGRDVDQWFLRKHVWPIVRLNMTCHVSHQFRYLDSRGCKDFPSKRVGTEFVGDVMPS